MGMLQNSSEIPSANADIKKKSQRVNNGNNNCARNQNLIMVQV